MDNSAIIHKITKWCAYQDRSEYAVYQKLKSWGIDTFTIHEIIEYLKTEGYLNEKRFVLAFVQGKWHTKKWGVEKIKYHLKHIHHVNEALIEECMKEIDREAYMEQLKQLLLKKKKLIEKKEKDSMMLRKKIINFALSKGYHLADIMELMKKNNL